MSAARLTFSFEKCLGRGGFGEVYLARLQRPGGLNKQVAVKVLKEDLRNAHEAVQRLRDEGRMLAILQHPCIVRVLEMTLIQGRVSLVTEYIDGIDLALCCKPPRLLPHKVVVGVVGEVASALHCAWTTPSPETGKALKLIHRDVKPENIRIGKHGEVKLLDFGIARTTEMFRHAKTAQGDLPFTPGYAAPEAFTKGFQGSSSDVYALGVSLYRLVAGERFYEDMDLSDQVSTCCLNERYTPFLRKRLADIDVPDGLRELLRDMLAYEAVDRPSALQVEQRCVALADALDGPTHVRWARGVEFPEPKGLDGGSLTGLTIEEDVMQGPQRPATPRGVRLEPRPEGTSGLLGQVEGVPAPPPVAAPSLVADLTPPVVDPEPHPPSPAPSRPPPRAPNRTPTPPPLPAGLAGNSVRPNTGPVTLQHYLPVPEEPTTTRMPMSGKATLDGFIYEEAETERLTPEQAAALEADALGLDTQSPAPEKLFDGSAPPPPPRTASLVPADARRAGPPPSQVKTLELPGGMQSLLDEVGAAENPTHTESSGPSLLGIAAGVLVVGGLLSTLAAMAAVALGVGWMLVMG